MERGASRRCDIECVCVYYPHWHRYPKGDEWFGADRWRQGEWEFVKTAKPRFPGHRQPIVPLLGYLDGASPSDVEKEIDLAADAGIGVFLYDYYYYGGCVTQEEALEQGFLCARNRDRMKFAIMWCLRLWRQTRPLRRRLRHTGASNHHIPSADNPRKRALLEGLRRQ